MPWYKNLGPRVQRDLGEAEKGIAAFQHVTEIAPHRGRRLLFFAGYLYSQRQKYGRSHRVVFRKGLALNPFHASSEFGLAAARASNERGDGWPGARETSGALPEDHHGASRNSVRRGAMAIKAVTSLAGSLPLKLYCRCASRDFPCGLCRRRKRL